MSKVRTLGIGLMASAVSCVTAGQALSRFDPMHQRPEQITWALSFDCTCQYSCSNGAVATAGPIICQDGQACGCSGTLTSGGVCVASASCVECPECVPFPGGDPE